jgi:hypothetical protein
MAGLTVIGVAAAGLWRGMPGVVGFVTGAAFSAVNFWFWHRMVQRVGEPQKDGEEPRKTSVILFGIRYFLFVGGVYATIRYFEASISAALIGVFVAVAAVLVEIVFELIYGT